MQTIVGQQLGNYRILTLLGSGGFADVYKAENIYISHTVAIKVLTGAFTKEDEEKLRQEAAMLASLHHPHIVQIRDFGVMSGVGPYLIMDFAPDGTLRQPAGSRLLPEEVARYVKQVASALQYVHDRNILHLDIKPENMLLGANNEAELSDFGVSLALQQVGKTKLKGLIGTPDYMAPEHLKGYPSAASDQYALAAVVYEWLCGTCPFTGPDPNTIIAQQLSTPPPPLRTYVPSISMELEQVVLRALAKQEGLRYPSVQAFADALEQAVQGSASASSTQAPPSASTNPPPSIMPPTVLVQPVSGPTIKVPSVAVPATQIVAPPPAPTRSDIACLYQGHTASVCALAWSPDSKYIASVSEDASPVHIWEAYSGQTLLTYTAHYPLVRTLGWSPDGHFIASGDAAQVIHVWHAQTGKTERHLQTSSAQLTLNATFALSWSPCSQYLAAGSDDALVQVWEVQHGKSIQAYRGHQKGINALDWSSTGHRIASASAGRTDTIQIWSAFTGDRTWAYEIRQPAYAVAWSPDGTLLAVGCQDRCLRIWETVSNRLLHALGGHRGRVSTLSWSPDGQQIASASDTDRQVHIWDSSSGQRLFTYRGHTQPVRTLAWSRDGSFIASAGDDQMIHVWLARS